MKLDGFIGAAYTLDSPNVDAQRCVNLYPEMIESGKGKEGQVAYLRGTPGLEKLVDVGEGPIRCVHVDSIGRVFVVSGAKIFSVSTSAQWRLQFSVTTLPQVNTLASDWNATTDVITHTAHGYPTGLKIRFNSYGGSIAPDTVYYIIRVDADKIKLATSYANAVAGIALDFTTMGIDLNFLPQAYAPLNNVEYSAINFASNLFTRKAHGLFNGLPVKFTATAAYPAGLSPSTTYYITQAAPNTFKLASTFANALAGTAVELSAASSDVFVKQMGAFGEYGGSSVTLATSSGPVRAASMSAGGNGTDSSTIFVDGSNNYLLQDLEGTQTLGVLGSVSFSQAILDITNDITVKTLTNIDDHVLSTGLTVSDEVSVDTVKVGTIGENAIGITLYKDVVDTTGSASYVLKVARGAPSYAEASIDLVDSMLVRRNGPAYDEMISHLISTGITVQFFNTPGSGAFVRVEFYRDTVAKTGAGYYRIDVFSEDLTTAQLWQGLATGTASGKTFLFNQFPDPAPVGYVRELMDRTDYTFTGGGSQSVAAVFGTPSNKTWTQVQGAATSLTTAELVTALSTGTLSGRDVRIRDWTSVEPAPAGTTRTQVAVSNYTFEGGGAQATSSAFGTPVHANFTREVAEGQGFGSVPSATHIVWSDGYFIVNQGGTNKFFISGLQDFEINTLDFASSEGSPDIVLAVEILNRLLYIFNERTIEVYSNTGNPLFPFERIQGGFIEVGALAKYSVAKAGAAICWLGRTVDGDGIVFMMNGTTPQRISTHAIEQAIKGYANQSAATAYTYQAGGHSFYSLNFDEATWVFDLSTQQWHERAYLNGGTLERHRSGTCAFVPSLGQHLVGDYKTSKLYAMSENTYSDDGDAIMRMRSTPHISSEGNRITYSRFMLDMETGIGLDGDVQGSSPTVMLDWSNDSGRTWSSEQFALADVGGGEIGDFRKRVIWRRLGSSRDRIFRVKFTDPCKVRLISASIDVEGRTS